MDNWKDAMLRYLNAQPDEQTVEANVIAAAHMLWVNTERKEPGARLTELRVRVLDDGSLELGATFDAESH